MSKHSILMAALGGLIVAIVAGAASSIIGLATGGNNILADALAGATSCFFIFFAAFMLMPLWDSSESKSRHTKPSH